MSASAFNRSVGESAEFEQLIQENEEMLAEISSLRPECEKLHRLVKSLQEETRTQERKIVALVQEQQCLREESDRLRSIVASRDKDSHVSQANRAEQSEVIINTFRTTTDHHHKSIEEHLFKLRGDVQQVLAMQQQAAATAGHAEATKAAAVASEAAHQELTSVRKELSDRTQERDEALERIRLMQAQWEATQQQTQALTKEKLTLRERAEQLVASANVTGSDVAHLIADIFDSCEAEAMELKSKVATREMLRNDDKQVFSQEIGRLQRANKELSMRLQRTLKMVEDGASSPLSTRGRSPNESADAPVAAASHFDAVGSGAGGSPQPPRVGSNLRRLTLSRAEDGQLTARTQQQQQQQVDADISFVGDNNAAAARTIRRAATDGAATHSLHTTAAAMPRSTTDAGESQQQPVNECPRCTFVNEVGARVCAVCDMQLVARHHNRQPRSSVSPQHD